MHSSQVVPAANQLLAAIPQRELTRLQTHHQAVELMSGDVLCKKGEDFRYVYFPGDSIVSLAMPIEGGLMMEVGLVGNEGMLGASLMLGVHTTPFHGVIQRSGAAMRIPTASFIRELEQCPALRQVLGGYLYVLMYQLAQTAVCNRRHVVEQRLARLLLMIGDRVHAERFHITHELLAQMLGVRRVGVTKAAGALQKRNLISYRRGDITIHDRTGLEAASCGCYQADNEVYARIMA